MISKRPDRMVAFRADASLEVGGGHVMRCLTLAHAFKQQGWQTLFAGRSGTAEAVGGLLGTAHRFVEIDDHDDIRSALHSGGRDHVCDLLVVDSYGLDREFESACRPWSKRIMAIDDLANRPHDCDFLLDATYERDAADYRTLVPEPCRLMIGPHYALLRDDFVSRRRTTLDRRATGEFKRVLIQFGMGDPQNMTGLALDAVRQSGLEVGVDVVVSGRHPFRQQIEATIDQMSQNVVLHVDAENIAELMSNADLAIGAAGTTTWERCALGLPSVVVNIAENQNKIAQTLSRQNIICYIGLWHQITSDGLAHTLLELAADHDRRATMVERSAQLCDGLGTRRVMLTLDPEYDANGRPVSLRPADAEDLSLTYAWQCEPEMRRYFRNPKVPSEAEHRHWFEAQRQNRNSLLNIIEVDARPAGQLRLDRRDGDEDGYEISILIAASYQGAGVGSAAIRAARRLVQSSRLYAEIDSRNEGSKLSFMRAGFRGEDNWFVAAPLSAEWMN